jgi:hypothetical protein
MWVDWLCDDLAFCGSARGFLPHARLNVAPAEFNSDSHSLVGQVRYLVSRQPCFG